jgi:hypothetical protein
MLKKFLSEHYNLKYLPPFSSLRSLINLLKVRSLFKAEEELIQAKICGKNILRLSFPVKTVLLHVTSSKGPSSGCGVQMHMVQVLVRMSL